MSEAESKKIFQKAFNDLLHDYRLTQKEVAAICAVSTSTVSTWSKGINMPRMDKIEKLANYFNLPKSHFIEDAKHENHDVRFALFGEAADQISEEALQEVLRFAEFVKAKELGK